MGAIIENDKVVVVINLNGGNDSLNMTIPLDKYSEYFNVRPNLAIAQGKVLKLTDSLGFHPAMQQMANLFTEGRLSIIQGAGMVNYSRSHFRAQDIWNSASNADVVWGHGWLGRMCEAHFPANAHPSAIKMGTVPSLALQGENGSSFAMTLASDKVFYDFVDNTEPFPPGYGGERMKFIREVRRTTEAYSAEVKKAADKVTQQYTYPDHNPLAAQLKVVARLVAGGLRTKTYIVTLDEFDTHAVQVNRTDTSTGKHAELLTMLSEAIAAFNKDLDFLGIADRVIGMTYSEFSRTVRDNGSLGTDHGGAGTMFIFGKNLDSNKIWGQSPDLTVNEMKMQFDYRQVYAAALDYMGANIDEVLKQHFDPLSIFAPVVPPPSRNLVWEIFNHITGMKTLAYDDNTWEAIP